MNGGDYVVYGYNKQGKMFIRRYATSIIGIKASVGEMYDMPEVKRISIQPANEEPMRINEGVVLCEKIDALIDSLKTTNDALIDKLKVTNKELSKICNAICMK